MKKDINNNWKAYLIKFIISVLGTSIGVGLTFTVSKIVENSKKKQAQRITAMMVIDDMEKSLEIVENIRMDEESRHAAIVYTMEHLNAIDSISKDTLTLVANYIMEGSYISTNLEFSESGEKVFQSAQDAWMNLNDIGFIRKADEFYKTRTIFKNSLVTHYYWVKPVSKTENDEMLLNSDILDSWDKYNTYLKNKLEDSRTQKFVSLYPSRMAFYNNIIAQWKNWIEDCKKLINITDEDMEKFRAE